MMAAVSGSKTVSLHACTQSRRAREYRSCGGRCPLMCLPATLSWHRQRLQTQHRRMRAISRKLSRAATPQQQSLLSTANRLAVRPHAFVHARRQTHCLCAPLISWFGPHDMQMTWDTPFGFDRCCSAAGRHYEEAAPQPQATATKPCACRTACAADQHER